MVIDRLMQWRNILLSRYFLQTLKMITKNLSLITLITFSCLVVLSSSLGEEALNEDQSRLFSLAGAKSENVVADNDLPKNGTEGFYLSPHALGKQIQVEQALGKILSNIHVQKTVYNHSDSVYTIDNFILELEYNDGKQKIQIGDYQEVTVTNGTVFFGYKFNYSVSGKTRNVNGYAHGSVYSDSLTYKKTLFFNNEGFLEWTLPKTNAYNDLKISSRMGIKRMEPYDQNDHDVLLQMLDRAFQSIQPSNIQSQLLHGFNSQFFIALNDSLNHEVWGSNINYTYQHPTKGPLNMTMVHRLYGFSIDKIDGYKIIYATGIDGHEKQSTCNMSVPDTHYSFEFYGGVQNIHLNCLYQDVVNFIQAQGWLDTKLNADWQVDAFQFYAGDLYDVMSSLYTRVNPRTLLEGQCKANKNNLILKSSREFMTNTYSLNIDYNCTVRTTTKTAQAVDILQFIAETKFYIKAYPDKLYLNFEIVEADVESLSFTPVNNFIVTNMNLALFKATQIIRKNLNWKTFGSGFPSLARQTPMNVVEKDWVIYYDASAFEMQKQELNTM